MKPLGQGASITIALDDSDAHRAIWATRGAAEKLETCRVIFDFLGEATAGDFAWDVHGPAISGILEHSSTALAHYLDDDPRGHNAWNDLTRLSDRLKALKEAADGDQ